MTFSCWKCGARIEYPTGSCVGRRDSCPKCDSDLHSCRNCRFYDPSKPNQCSEIKAARVENKESANLCEYYTPNPTLYARGETLPAHTDAAKKKINAFFGERTRG